MLSFFRQYYRFIKPYQGKLFWAVFSMILVDLSAYVLPEIVEYLTDDVFPYIKEPGMTAKMFWICTALIGSGLLRGLLSYIMIRCYWSVGESVVRDLRNYLYDKIQHLQLAFYDQSRVGDLMSRLTTDIRLIKNFFAFGIEHRLRILLLTATVFLLMILLNLQLALIIYGILPVFFYTIIRFSTRMRDAVNKKQQQIGAFASRIQENLTGIRVVKAFAVEEEEKVKYDRENRELLKREKELSLLQVYLNPLLLLINGIGTLVIILYGGWQYINGDLSMGILMGFITYLGLMGWPVAMLAFNTSLVSQALGAATRISEIIKAPDQKQQNQGKAKDFFKGRITFRKVSFAYTKNRNILEDVDFTIEPGEKVALFGLTGAGKSSLISMIPRFYPPTRGEIKIDGKNIENWELKALRSQIGIVLQETFLFSASLAENIAYGKPGASFDEIQDAARHAHIHDFIEALPQGYNTKVGEYGIGLSGGQKQRIAIARTLLQDPKLLILDDCTSSLDSITEHKIQMQLKELMIGRTSIIIAQRVAAFALVDRIIVLNKGRVQDFDSHSRLLQRNRLYRDNFLSQQMEIPSEEN